MKIAFVLLPFLLLICPAFGQQNPFVREGSIGDVKKKSPERIGPGTIEPEEWVGQKFILLPQNKSTQGSFLGFDPPLPYKNWVGKILVVTEIDKQSVNDQSLRKVHFRSEDGKLISARLYDDSIDEIAPLRDLEFARNRWLGKTIWIKQGGLNTWNDETSEFGFFKFQNCSPLKVIDVIAGWYADTPIRLILKSPDGREGYDDINVSGTNVADILRKHGAFEENFMEDDPRLTKKWPQETWKAIEDKKVFIGMTAEQAEWSWGKPKEIRETLTARGSEQQWIYHDNKAIYVSADKVTAAQN
jgi:hypothetical protein